MKTKQILKTALLAAIVAFSACKKNNDQSTGGEAQVTATINGTSAGTQSITLSGAADETANGGKYVTGGKYTFVKVVDTKTNADNTKDSFILDFDGSGKSSQTLGANLKTGDGNFTNVGLILSVHIGGKVYLLESSSGTVNVDTYDAVGGTISGNFVGVLINDANQKTLTVSNGKFTAKRAADIAKVN